MNSPHFAIRRWLLALTALCVLVLPLSADQFGDFTYTSDGSNITITGYTGAGGSITIPSTIISLPVKIIGHSAFYQKATLTSVNIPASVIGIGDNAFSRCTAITAFEVDAANPSYISIDGILFNKALTSLIQCPAAKSGTYAIPSSVTSIESSAFFSCTGLTSVSIPASVASIGNFAFALCSGLTTVSIPAGVTSIGGEAFVFCSGLTNALFIGNAPTMGPDVFYGTAAGFNIHYLTGKSGFTSPTWQGYPAVELPSNPAITIQPASQTIASGSTATLTVTASGEEALSYQWYQGISGDTTTPVGTNSASFTTPVLTSTTNYWVRASNAVGTADSNTATINVNPPATTFTWATAASGNWSDPSKWTNNLSDGTAPVPAGRSDYTLTFGNSGTYTTTNDLNLNFLLNRLDLISGSAVTIDGDALQFVANGATQPQITHVGTIQRTIHAPLLLAADLSVGFILGTGTLAITDSITGPGGLSTTGTGTLQLTAANTYTGPTTVSGGTLALGGGSQASPITVNSGASLGFTLGAPTVSSSSVNLGSGTVKISGTPVNPSYTLMTAAGGFTGMPVLDAPIPGYTLLALGNDLKLNEDGDPVGYSSWQAVNSTAGAFNEEHDNDGVLNGIEYFLGGANGNTTGLTLLPGVTNTGGIGGMSTVTWTKAADYPGTYGTNFVVEISGTSTGPWTPMPLGTSNVVISGNDVNFTFSPGSEDYARLTVFGPGGTVASTPPLRYGWVNIDYIAVGDPGNPVDPAWGFGAVPNEYKIARYAVTNSQYAEFLNAKAATDPYSLYNPGMSSHGITQSGSAGSFTYGVTPGFESQPVVFVSWFDAARFVNWLANGQGGASTETGTYTLNGTMSGFITYNEGAAPFIPSEDEWWKAALYNGDTASYSTDASFYGLVSSESIVEWTDSETVAPDRLLLSTGPVGFSEPTAEENYIGFRVASVSEAHPSITTQPASQTIASGSTAILTVTATGTEPFTYQWYQGTSGDTTTPVGTNSVSFTTPALTSTTSYWVKVSNAANPAGVNSDTATVTTASPASDFTWTSDGSAITITGYTGVGGAIVVPSMINELTVTGIGYQAFYNKASLTSVIIPDSVTSIGGRAFAICSNLTMIQVDATNPNYSALDGVLFDKAYSTLIQYPAGKSGPYTIPSSVTRIENYGFFHCIGLSSLNIPSSVTGVGAYAFYGCRNLTSATIPSSVTSIGYRAFGSCHSLTVIQVEAANPNYSSLDGVLFDKTLNALIRYPAGKSGPYSIPASVTSIGDYAFIDCFGLTSVTIPNSVTSIGEAAFNTCAGLIALTIPASVTSIGDYAFIHCVGLTNALFTENAPTMGTSVFNNTAPGFTIYYISGKSGFTSPTWQGYPSVVLADAPEIAVEQSAGTDLGTGAGLAFGNAIVGGTPVSNVFTIRNAGGQILSGLSLSVAGSNPGDFQITPPAATSLAPLESITFSVAFAPAASGSRQATLNIASNDADENPFVVHLSGTATIPVEIVQQAYLKASNTGTGDYFGYRVAASGDTVVVGAYAEDSGATTINGDQANNAASAAGAVYVFVRESGVWVQQAYLKADNAQAGDAFGYSVAISGDTIIVGAPWEASNASGVNQNPADNSLAGSGAAYVFVRNGTTWSQHAYLKASNPGADDSFGSEVAISGDIIVVSAYREDGGASGVDGNQVDNSAADAGAAYVFERSAGQWAQTAYLKPSNTDAGDLFGSSIDVSGDTVVVGTDYEDSAATGINGNQSDNSASGSGAAYVFTRNETGWIQQAYLKASNTQAGDSFGRAVSVSGDTIAVGAYFEDGGSIGVNGDQNNNSSPNSGSVYVFTRNGGIWEQEAYLKSSEHTGVSWGDYFGIRVSIQGNLLAVGAFQEDSAASGIDGDPFDNSLSGSGAAYLFTRDGGIWSQRSYLKASNTEGTDLFGYDIALADGALVVGAVQEDSAATGVDGDQSDNSAADSGAAYVFAFSNDGTLSIAVQPKASQTVAAGVTAQLTVTAFGTPPLTYQWYQGSSGDTSAPVGTNSASFTTPALNTSTSYWVRVSNAANPTGVNSNTATVTLAPPPLVTTGPADWLSGHHTTGAHTTLAGAVNPNGLATTVQFEYGPTTDYGSIASVNLSPNDGTTPIQVSANLGSLPAGSTYHYRLTATNAGGTTSGDDRIFITDRVSGNYRYATNDDTATITGYTGPGGEVTIPGTINGLPVTGIGYRAFAINATLTGVVIPDGVTTIGTEAFYFCKGLTSVTIPDSVTTIGYAAFRESDKLASVNLPENLTSIGDLAFYYCLPLTHVTIPSSTTTIGAWAFWYCGLTTVTIPGSVTTIGEYAFRNCTALNSAAFQGNAPTMGTSVFSNTASGFIVYYLEGASGFTTPTWQGYPAVEVTDGSIIAQPASEVIASGGTATLTVTPIGTEPFTYQWYQGESGDTSMPVGTNSSSFTTSALTATTSYWVRVSNPANPAGTDSSTVTVTVAPPPSVTTGPAIWLLSSYTTLTGTVNPNGLATTVRFEYGLTTAYGTIRTVTLYPNNGSTDQAVSNNLGALPAGTTYHYRISATNAIGTTTGEDRTFVTARTSGDYTYMTADNTATISGYTGTGVAVTIPPTVNGLTVTSIGYRAFYNKSTLTSVTIPAGVASIGQDAFYLCRGLTSVSIPDGVTSIGSYAFYSCTGLTSVTIPDSVTSIGSYAFYSCTGLTSVTIPDSVSSIGSSAFTDCNGLTSIMVDALNPAYSSLDGVLFDKNQSILIQYPAGKTGSYLIPGSVINIGAFAFYDSNGLTGVTIPGGVTGIGSSAFASCDALTSVAIPGSVTTIGSYAFSLCRGLTLISVDPLNPAYSSLDGVLFNKGQSLLIQCPAGKTGSYAIPGSVTSIGAEAFYYCAGLTSVTIPGSVTSIGDYAFYKCTGLTGVTIPGGVTSIGSYAFSDCTGLASVTIPNSVTSIGSSAFRDCTGLTSVVVSNGVTSIGLSAFYNCTRLRSVTIPSSVSNIGSYAFYNCAALKFVGFAGNAPTLGTSAFLNTASDFSVYYFQAAVGFTTPLWQGYPAMGLVDGSIAIQPAPVSIALGSAATLSVIPFGTEPFTYQWYRGASGDTSTPVGTNSASFTTPALNATTNYWVRVSNAANPAGVNSDSAAVTVSFSADVIAGPIVNPANGHSYYLLTQNTWAASEAVATTLGGHLVTINDADENTWVLDTFSNYGGSYKTLWIGLNDRAVEGTFVWSSGETATFRNWYSGEPNNSGGAEDNTHIYDPSRGGGYVGKWNDAGNSTIESGVPLHGVVEVDATTQGSVVFTYPATAVTETTATLNGTVNPNGLATAARFEYGLTTAYGNTVDVVLSPADGTTAQTVSAVITGLAVGQTYHFRLTATNSGGTLSGNDAILTATPAGTPNTAWVGLGTQTFPEAIWGGVANWSTGVAAGGTNHIATFGNSFGDGYACRLNIARTLGRLVYNDPANANDFLLRSDVGDFILTLDVTSGLPSFNVAQGGRTLAIQPRIGGNDGFAKNGPGRLVLANGNSTYTGPIQVNAGLLEIGGGVFTVNNGKAAPNYVEQTFDLGTTGRVGNGNYAGSISIAGGAGFLYNSSADSILNGIISGDGTLGKAGAGMLTLTNANTYTGTTTVGGGTLRLGSSSGLPAATDLVMDGGKLDLNGQNAAIKSLFVGGTDVVIDFGSTGGANILQITDGASGAWTGNVQIRNFEPAVDQLFFGSSTDGIGENAASVSFVDPVGLAPGTYAFTIGPDGAASLIYPPFIATQPAGQSIAYGTAATLTVAASGSPTPSFQWYQGNTGDTSTPVGTNASGFTTPALTANASYWVRIANSEGSADSNTALVTVIPLSSPEITVEGPDGVALTNGDFLEAGGFLIGTSSDAITLVVRNTGNAALENLTVNLGEEYPGDVAMDLSSFPASIPAGESANITLTFTPGGEGPRSSALSIASNDADENPFVVNFLVSGVTPMSVAQQAYFKASNTDTADLFGFSVAVSGDTVVVGAPGESSNATGVNGDETDNSEQRSGAAYVFVRDGTGNWIQQAYLKASNTDEDDRFGSSVAISGDTVVVGAWWEASNATGVNGDQSDNSAIRSGAAYVFVRDGTGNWAQEAYLKASNTNSNDAFGGSVAVSGDTVVVGAGLEGSGAAYVFDRNGAGNWTQQAYLKASNGEQGDLFGYSVAVSGDTVVVGAHEEDSNATGINGNESNNSAISSGAAYVFVRDGSGNWMQQAYLKASNTDANDLFGISVAISGSTVVIGASGEGSSSFGVNGDETNDNMAGSGAAYMFFRDGSGNWSQQAYLKPSNPGLGDAFGESVAISGATVVVGAQNESSFSNPFRSGAAYAFVRDGSGAWNQEAYLKASTSTANDSLGYSVAVSGDTVMAGAPDEDSAATGIDGDAVSNGASDSGAAYSFFVEQPQIPPTIITQPASQMTTSGSTAGLFVTAIGNEPFIFQWYQGNTGDTSTPVGTNAPGFTTPALTANASYWVRVTNSEGSADSNNALVTVLPPSANANLASLVPGTGALTPQFNPAITAYGVGVGNQTTNINFTPVASHPGATIRINGTTVASNTASEPLLLNVGLNQIETEVTAQDGSTKRTYNVTVTRAVPASVATLPAEVLDRWLVRLKGSAVPSGTVSVFFQYGPTTAYGSSTPLQLLTGNTSQNFQADVGGLPPNAPFHFRAVATGAFGTIYGNDSTFTTAAEPPVAATGTPAAVTNNSATLVGAVDPKGLPTTVRFEYGLTTLYGNTTPPQLVTTAGGIVDFLSPSGGLIPNATYHYRIVAENTAGTSYGEDVTFEVKVGSGVTDPNPTGPPSVTTGSVAGVSTASAILQGSVNPNQGTTVVQFQYGLSPAYGQVTPVQGVGNGTSSAAVSIPSSGLQPGTTYHYRLTASNSLGTSFGEDATFTTAALPPAVFTGDSEVVNSTTVRVNGTVKAGSTPAEVFVDYGTDPFVLSASVQASPANVSGESHVPVTAELGELAQGTTYHYRVRAVGEGGLTAVGETESFQVALLSGLIQSFPAGVPAGDRAGSLRVDMNPAPTGAGWRFIGEKSWRDAGTAANGLTTGDRLIEYRPVAGHAQPPSETATVTSGQPQILLERGYTVTGETGSGSLTVTLRPESITDESRDFDLLAKWAFYGETDGGGQPLWRSSEETVSGLMAGNHLIIAKPVEGRDTPQPVNVRVRNGQTTTTTITYYIAEEETGTPPVVIDFETVSSNSALPYAYVGQIRTDAGMGSGFVARPGVVATAGHVVFDDGTLSSATGVQWLLQQDQGTHEPLPLAPRGYYVLTGYAAQRADDDSPGTSTPASQNLDAAALYFPVDPGRGGFSGYLASDATSNEFLLSDALKTMVGYPVDGITPENLNRMHATPPAPVVFTKALDRTYTTGEIRGSGGASGGPLCVRHPNGVYYPAAIYLGGTQQMVVRSIDSDVAALVGFAELSAASSAGDSGGGLTGDNLTSVPTPELGALEVMIEPENARAEGAGWRIQASAPYLTSGERLDSLQPNSYTIQFASVPGYVAPTPQTVSIGAGLLRTVTFTYEAIVFPPVITSPETVTGNRGQPLVHPLTASGSQAEFSVLGTLPAGLSFDPAGNTISGTPSEAGVFDVLVGASNSGGSDSKPLKITSLPVLANQTRTAPYLQIFHYPIVSSESGGGLLFAAEQIPPGLGLNPETGVLSGTPYVAGTFNVPIKLTRRGATASAVLTLNFTATAPVIGSTSPVLQTIPYGGSGVMSVEATGLPAPSYQWYRGISGDTSQPVAAATSPVFATTPLTTEKNFWVRVSSISGSTDSATFTISVLPSPNAYLATLTPSSGLFSPPFNPGIFNYSLRVAHASSAVALTPVPEVGGATVGIQGIATPSGVATAVALNVGANPVTVEVTAADGTTTQIYNLVIDRAPPATASTAATADAGDRSAILAGTVTPNGEATVFFEYGTTDSYGSVTPGIDVSGFDAIPVQTLVTGLEPDTLYHYRIVVSNTSGTINGGDLTFTTRPAPPLAATGNPVIDENSVTTLVGATNPSGRPTTVYFEYGPDTNYGQTTPPTIVPAGGNVADVLFNPPDLIAGNIYHYRLVAENDSGTAYGEDVTFQVTPTPGGGETSPPGIPTADILPAIDVTSATALLRASVNPERGTTFVRFEYGLTPACESATESKGVGNGDDDALVVIPVQGLLPGTLYHYRAVATNSLGSTTSTTSTFTTAALAPFAVTGDAVALGATSARITGTVRARGVLTDVFVEFGEDGQNFPDRVRTTPGEVSSVDPVEVYATLNDLPLGRGIFYRLAAERGGGTRSTGDVKFVQPDALVGLVQRFTQEVPVASRQGAVTVILNPPDIGGWRFVGERSWRPPGTTVRGLANGDRVIEFLPVAGYVQPPRETIGVVSGENPIVVERSYYETPSAPDAGLQVVLQPVAISDPSVPAGSRAQWRFAGESVWRNSGEEILNLLPGNHLIECRAIPGFATPPPTSVDVSSGNITTFTLTYPSAGAPLLNPPTVVSFTSASTSRDLPYAYVGQFRTNSGNHSGFVVKPRVVATTSEAVFDDAMLSIRTGMEWLLQRDQGTYEPRPLVPRGAHVFDGYASQRIAEGTPGTLSIDSQNLNVAALYFSEDAGRGGFSGFLGGSQQPNEHLVSSSLKTLIGYPSSGVSPSNLGRMHATGSSTAAFTHLSGQVHASGAIRGFGGMAGGPLCVRYQGGAYYPAAIYLGGGAQSLVRAIDGDIITMFNRAEVSGNGGDNDTGGGITQSSFTDIGSTTDPGAIRVNIEPQAARDAGAGWRLSPEASYRQSGSQKSNLTPREYILELGTVSGFQNPGSQTVVIEGGKLTEITYTYQPVNAAPTLSALANITLNPGTASGAIPFTIGDSDTDASALMVTDSSSNPALVPGANILLGGSGANRTVTITPLPGMIGTTAVGLNVHDGLLTTSRSFVVTVTGTPLETWRFANFGSTLAQGPAADDADPDGDGQNNRAEFAAGTDPNNPADVFRVLTSTLTNGRFTVTAPGKAGRSYTLQRGTSPSGPWTDIATSGPVSDPRIVTLEDENAPGIKAFYRVMVTLH